MRDSLATDNRREVSKASVRVAEFVEIQFPGGTIRTTSAPYEITWGGMTFSPTPVLSDIGNISERSDLKSERVTMSFSGLDSDLTSRILSDAYHFASINAWIGFFNDSWQLITTPHQIVSDLLLSNCTLTLEPGTGSVSVSGEGWELLGLRDAAQLATPESQKLRYSGDTGQDRVAVIPEEEIEWGGSFERS